VTCAQVPCITICCTGPPPERPLFSKYSSSCSLSSCLVTPSTMTVRARADNIQTYVTFADLRYGGRFYGTVLLSSLISVCNSERIIKIGQCLPKLCSNKQGSSFLLPHRVVSYFLSYSGWHTLPLHDNAEACLTGWPNAQPQGRD